MTPFLRQVSRQVRYYGPPLWDGLMYLIVEIFYFKIMYWFGKGVIWSIQGLVWATSKLIARIR